MDSSDSDDSSDYNEVVAEEEEEEDEDDPDYEVEKSGSEEDDFYECTEEGEEEESSGSESDDEEDKPKVVYLPLPKPTDKDNGNETKVESDWFDYDSDPDDDDETSSRASWDKEKFDYVATHVVFPSRILKNIEVDANVTTSDSYSQQSAFADLLSSVVQENEDLIPITSASVKLWKSCAEIGTFETEDAKSQPQLIARISDGQIFPFYIPEHNIALLISKPNSIQPENLVMSWFRPSADANGLNSCHKLISSYPEYSFEVPFSDLIKSEDFAQKLGEFMIPSNRQQYIRGNKGNKEARVSQFIEWLTMTLMGADDPIRNISKAIKPIHKSIRDEAMHSGGNSHGRGGNERSALWTTLKIALHLSLIQELGDETGTIVYKLLMIRVFALMCKFQISLNPNDLASGIEFLARLGLKIDKLEKKLKIKSEVSIDEKFLKLHSEILSGAREMMVRINKFLEVEWKSIVKAHGPSPLKDSTWSAVEKAFSKLSISLGNYTKEYAFSEDRIKLLLEYIQKRKEKIGAIQDASNVTGSGDSRGQRPHPINPVVDFGKSLWIEGTIWDPSSLVYAVNNYLQGRCRLFKDDPFISSSSVLTLLRTVQILDHMSVQKFPILKEHKLFDFDVSLILEKLLLRTHEDVERANILDKYFIARNSTVIPTYPSLISEEMPTEKSPAVRIAGTNPEMKVLEAKILMNIKENEQEQLKEFQDLQCRNQEIHLEYLKAPCICTHVKAYPNQHTYNNELGRPCPKIVIWHRLMALKMDQYEYPIPTFSIPNKRAIIFELMIPPEVAALRDVLLTAWPILSPNSNVVSKRFDQNRNTQGFISPVQFPELTKHISGTPLSNRVFHLAKKSVNLKRITIRNNTAYSLVMVRNEDVKYVWPPGGGGYVGPAIGVIWNTIRSTTPKIELNMKLDDGSKYKSLQKFLEGWTHTHNDVLCKISECDPRLHVSEFIEFGSLRAGNRLQYRNICRALLIQSLSFNTEEVFNLICQTIWQVGPFDNNYSRDNHADLNDLSLVQELLCSLEQLLDSTKENWVTSFTLMIIVVISLKIFEFNEFHRARSVSLIRKCRKVAADWIKKIQKAISESSLTSSSGAIGLKQNLIDTTIAGAFTFCVSEHLIGFVLETAEDANHWLTFAGTIHNEVNLSRWNPTGQRTRVVAQFLQLIASSTTIAPHFHAQLNSIIKKNLQEVLRNYTQEQINRKVGNVKWSNGQQSSEPQIYFGDVELQANAKVLRMSRIEINILTGEFLLDGSPMSKLPEDISQSEDFVRIFGSMEFRVRKAVQGRKYRTSDPIKGCYYEFEATPACQKQSQRYSNLWSYRSSIGTPLITEIRGTSVYELIPLQQLKGRIPFLLLDEFSHWWNRGRHTIEFRKASFESDDFAKPKYVLHLNTRDLVECATKNTMTFRGDEIHDKIMEILKKIELPEYILIWKQDGEIVAKLPRYGISFKWVQEGHLVCQEYNDMKIATDFHLKTLIGLKRFIVLEEECHLDSLKARTLLVPHGSIIVKNDISTQAHQSVEINIERGELKNPPYFIFQIDEMLQILRAGQSTSAWLYLAALHAATTSPLVDPFIGLTGLEMAVHILQSGHSWSCKPYDAESISSLKFINDLSPIRTIKTREFGKNMKETLQNVKYPRYVISSYANYDGYHFIVKKLVEDSMQMKFLFPKKEDDADPWDVSDGRDLGLMTRAYWKNIKIYNAAAWIKGEFNPEFTFPPTSKINGYTLASFPVKPTIKDLHIISALTQKCNGEMKSDYLGKVRQLIYGSRDKNLEGLNLESEEDDNFALLQSAEEFRTFWIQWYAYALKCGSQGSHENWALLLCELAYEGNIDFCQLLILQCIAVNHSKFPQPPPISEYKSIENRAFTQSEVKAVFDKHKLYTQYFYKNSMLIVNSKEEVWAEQYDEYVAKQLERIETDWNAWSLETVDEIEDRTPFHTHLPSTQFIEQNGCDEINELFVSWENNVKLHLFVEKVENILAACITPNVHEAFDWRIPARSSFAKLAPPPQRNMGFDLPSVDFPEIGDKKLKNTVKKEDMDSNELQDSEIFLHFNSELTQLKRYEEKQWDSLWSAWNLSDQYHHMMPGGLFPRIVPITVLPHIMKDSTPPELKNFIFNIAVNWTEVQRARRILKFTLLGESREVHRKREIETQGHVNWDPEEFPEWLLLELEMNVMIRDIQAKVAKNMLDGDEGSSVTQLNMGEGKTSVIVPMLASTLAKAKDFCVRITVLKSLYETNYKGLSHALGGMLNQRVHLFPCSRDLPITLEQADLVLTKHKEIIQRKGIVLTIPEYRLSWELRAYESAGKDPSLCQKLMDVVKELYENARDILDESDEILSVKYQKVYALGISEKIDEVRWKVTQRIIKSVPNILHILSNTFTSCIELDNKKWNKRQSEVYTPCRLLNYTEESEECYKEFTKILATEFIESEFPTLEDSLKEMLLDFLTNPNFDEASYDELKSFCENDAVLGKKFEKSTVVAELLVHPGTLQSSLSKRWRVNYGVNPKSRRQIAVPFIAKDVAHEMTEFGHPGMAIILTQLSYYYSGLSDHQLDICFQVLENHIENPTVEFDSWVSAMEEGKRLKVRYSTLNLQFPPQRKQVFDALRKNMNVIDFWLSLCVFPKEIRAYPDKITCSGWDLCSGLKRTSGFSGTNDMSILLPKSITPKDIPELKQTNEEVRAAVEKCKNYQSLQSWVPSSKDILEILKENDIRVLFDAGALMIDMSNGQVAEQWLKIDDTIEAVVYFNEKNQLTVRNREKSDCPFELSPFSEKLDQCAVYLDDEHTRGTDLRFPDETVGCVTLGGRMTRDKLVQACMRLRLLQSGRHKLFFLSSREAHNQIINLIPENEENEVGIEIEPTAFNVMEWVCSNTKEFIKEGMVFWANSALNFVQKRAAIMNFQANTDYQTFAKQIQDGDGKGERSSVAEAYVTQCNYVQILPQKFDTTMNHLLKAGAQDFNVQKNIRKMYFDLKTYVVDTCVREIPDRICFSSNLDEEQEREIEQEKEVEREVSRPRAANPMTHQLHPTIIQFIKTGHFNPIRMEIRKTPFENLYATKDFLKVTNDKTSAKILRPVTWIAPGENKHGDPIFLLLSPFEVNELVQEYRKRTPKLNIHMFAPRLRKDQPILVNSPRLQLVGNLGANDASAVDDEDLAQIHMYAGTMYFDSGNEGKNEEISYAEVIETMQEENSGFNVVSFIGKNIEERHQHFPEKCDVYKFLKW